MHGPYKKSLTNIFIVPHFNVFPFGAMELWNNEQRNNRMKNGTTEQYLKFVRFCSEQGLANLWCF